MKHLLLVGFVLVFFLFPKISFAQNTSPIAVTDYVAVCENSGTITINVQANDFDLENNSLITSIYNGPLNGNASLSGNNIDYTPDLNFSGNDTIYYVICDNGSPSLCDTGLVVITVNPAPIADAESDETICLRDSVQIGTPGAMGVTYFWTPSTGLSANNVPQPYAHPVVPTTQYILTATNMSTGCQMNDTTIITVNPIPVANAGPDHIACEGDSVMLGMPGSAGNTYYWSPIPPLDWNSLPQPMAAPSTTTTFTLTVTTTATGCQNKDSVLVTINPAPTTNAGPDRTICDGDSVQLGSPAIAGNTYLWSPATGLSSANSAQPMAGPAVTTTYILTVTNTSTGCNDTNSVTVTVGTAPVVNAGPDQVSCSGASVMIGTPAVAGNTYSWSPTTGLSSPNSAQTMANPVATTNYTLTVTNTTSGCIATDVVVVTVGTTPTANAGSDQTICAGGNVVIGTPAVIGNSYSWSPVTGLSSSTAAQPVASPGVTTTYILTVTQTASGCQDRDTVIVTVTPAPIANAGPDKFSCNGDSVQIGTAAVAGVTYNWLPALGLSSSTIAQPMAHPLVTTSYTLTVTNTATGCTSADVVIVTVGAPVIANAGPDMIICTGDSALIGTPALPGNTYSWSPATGLSSSTAAQTFAHPATTTTYVLTVTNTVSGCQNSDTVIVTVNPLPIANAGPDQSACDGDSVQIGSAAVAGNTYVWLPVLGLSAAIVAQPMASPLVTTSYTLTVINTATGCLKTDVVVVTVGTTPVTNAGSDQSICIGDSAQIGTVAIAGNNYSWSPVAGLSSSTVAQPFAHPATTTVYVLTVTNSTSGCQGKDTVVVTVNPLPVANAGADQTSCSGDSVMIGTPTVAGTTYSWSPTTGLSSSTVAQPMASPAVSTTYTLTITNAAGCQNTDAVTVNVGTSPIANAGTDYSLCNGDSMQIGSPAVAGNTYSWSPSTGLSSSIIAQPFAHPSSTTTYTLTVTNASGCQSTDAVLITINPLPVADAGTDQTVCNAASAQIGTPGVAGYSYSWLPATGLSSAAVAQPIASPTATTIYTLTVTNSLTGCMATDLVTVTVSPLPATDAGADQTICAGDSIAIGTTGVAGNTYNWSPPTGLSASSVANPDASPAATTTYILTVTNVAGCTDADTVVVTVNPAPVANPGTGGTICKGDSVQIGAAPVAGNTYSWSPATGLSSTSSSQTYASPATTTTYTLTETIGSCSTSSTVTVVVQSPAIYAGADQTICDGSGGILGSPAVAGYTYLWTPSTGLSSATVAQPIANPGVTITYTLFVTDTVTGCTVSDVVTYGVGEDAIFNGFSPNGDGTNDWWNIPMVECYGNNEVIIINRWGNEIWKASNYDNNEVRWDGKNMNGLDVTDGTYYYIIKFNGTESRGWVFIKR
ncbi:MAG: gliding motility-associated C-terminal domain-containing protein [Bacteroidia bacterium]